MAKVLTIEKMEEDAQRLAGQAGAAYKYLKEVEENILKAEYDLQENPHKALGDLKRAINLIRGPEGRTERYLDRDAKEVLEQIKQLAQHLPKKLLEYLQRIEQGIEIPLKDLEKELSRTQGLVRGKLEELKKEIEQYEKTKQGRDQVIAKAQATITEIKETMNWIQSFEASLKSYEKFLEYLRKLSS